MRSINETKRQYNNKDLTIFRVQERSEGDGQEELPKVTNISEPNTSSKNAKQKDDYNIKNNLPNLDHITIKLNQCSSSFSGGIQSSISAPDPVLLSAPPKDFDKKEKFILLPKFAFTDVKKYSSIKRREPKFVPYEPYKGCVKPILTKSTSKGDMIIIDKDLYSNQTGNSNFLEDSCNLESKRFNSLRNDFEHERKSWEEKNYSLQTENAEVKQENCNVKKENNNLQQQLSTLSQVNTELKKLLVASVGEDVQGRVQCLTEDKARMATMIRKYSEKVDKDYEEKEKMSIQCDVWRSKFLASSLMIDELARWKGTLLQRFDAAKEALNLLLQERDIAHHNLITSYKHAYQVQEAFDPLHAQSSINTLMDSCDIVSVSVATSTMSENVRDRLLGSIGRAVGVPDLKLPQATQTPGEKLALQVLEDGIDPSGILVCCTNTSGSPRFQRSVNFDRITMNCCSNCNGEIVVV